MRHFLALLMAPVLGAGALTTVPAAPAAAADPCGTAFCAGAASVDMTWHTGAGQGQLGGTGGGIISDRFDPFHHQTKMVPSDGIQSRAYAKAVVLQGSDGTKVAYVKTELYLQQDVLARRVVQLVTGDDSDLTVEGLDASNIMLGGTHNHSAPHYTSTAWGVWLFADTFDFRAFEATARKIATAIKEADESLEPAKVGASVTRFDLVQQNIIGPSTADDGSPAGFPRDHFDDELAVVRFDAADGSRPIAALVNFGMHPESIDGADLISSDFVGVVERVVERSLGKKVGAREGPVVAWAQGGLGDVEPDRDARARPASEGHEFWRRGFSQTERMSRIISEAVLETFRDIERSTPGVPEKFVPFTDDPDVAMVDHRFAGPITHPVPTVSNCRTDKPAAPVLGLPDCQRGPEPPLLGTTLELLRENGIPVPGNIGAAPSYGGVQETLRIHLQALRIGDILLATCPCEPISDMALNFKTRADDVADNMHLGYEWECEDRSGDIFCNFRSASHRADDWRQVDGDAFELMRAQVRKDAAGWEEDLASLQGEHENPDTEELYGNFTHEELSPSEGYRLPLMIGKGNDYIGYIVTYREYQRGDHYRKALTPFGPHTSDYINTRLVKMAAELNGGPTPVDTVDTVVGTVDEPLQIAKTTALGHAGSAGTAVYEAAIPDDGGTPGEVGEEPASLERFGAASFSWQGGSNWTDNPEVVVQRLEGDDWETVATQEGGEVVLTLLYDSYRSPAPLLWLIGGKTYTWTATWEVFEKTPPGTYRFLVEGHHRSGRQANPYEVTSALFEVDVWRGIIAHDLAVDVAERTASFATNGIELTVPEAELTTDEDAVLSPNEIHFPQSYETDLRYLRTNISTSGPHRFCYRCTFRPWAPTGRIASATVTVHQNDGVAVTYPATLDGNRWVARGLDLADGDVIVVEAGGVRDQHGNVNGAPSNEIVIEGAGPRKTKTELTYTGATSGAIGDMVDVAAILTTAFGAPLPGMTIMFMRGKRSVSAVTDVAGVAAARLRVSGPPGAGQPLIVEFKGSHPYLPERVEVPFTATQRSGR